MFDGESFGREVVAAIKSAVLPLQKRIDELAAELGALAARQPEKGPPGEKGEEGVGIASSFIDQSGRLVFTFTDGTVGPVGEVVGRDGKDGNDAVITVEDICAPGEIADEISKALALVAEAPQIRPFQTNAPQPVVVNFTSPTRTAMRSKTITASRDANGNLVAKVIEDAD